MVCATSLLLCCVQQKNLPAGAVDYAVVKSYIQNRNTSDIRIYSNNAVFMLMSFTYVFVPLSRGLAHLLSISRRFKTCGVELSAAAQVFKTCANELSPIAQSRK